MPRVVLAMSGGVDSSVAADLLLREGYDVVGIFMRHGEESAKTCKVESTGSNPLLPILQGRLDHKQGCCSASDAADARRVADRLAIPFYAIDMQSDFRRIVDYFVDEYRRGEPPIRAFNATTGSSLEDCSSMPTLQGRSLWQRGTTHD